MENDSDDKPSEPKGTKYGFARIDGSGEQVDSSKAQLPTPGSKKQDAQTEAAAEAPVLRRVEHEMAEPTRLTASTHTGREILREQVEQGLAQQVPDGEPADDLPQIDGIDGLALRQVKSENLIKHDLLEAERPSPLQRGLQIVAWTRLRLIAALISAALVVIAVVVFVALRCGGSTDDKPPTPVVAGHLPGEKDDQAAPEKQKSLRADPGKPEAAPSSPSDYVIQVAAAKKLVEQNFCQDAAKMLLPVLRNKKPSKQYAEGYYLLGRSLVCGGKEREGLVAYERALIADQERYRHDKALVADMGFLLTRDKLQESTIQLVAKRIGEPAVEVMLAASSHQLQRVRAHAVAALERIGAAAKIDWQTTLWLDLQQLPCEQRPAVIEKIGQKLPAQSATKLLRAAVHSPKQRCMRDQLKQQLAKMKPARKKASK